MKRKDLEEFEEQTKDMSLENKMKYAEVYFMIKKMGEIDWGFVLMMTGLSMMLVCYVIKLLVDIGILKV